VYAPPGTEVAFSFTEEQVRAMRGTVLVTAEADPRYVLAGVMYNAIVRVAGADHATTAALFSLLAAQQCLSSFANASGAGEQATELMRCLLSHSEGIRNRFIELALKVVDDPRLVGQSARLLHQALLTIEAFKLGAQLGEPLADRQLAPAARQLSVFTTAASRQLPRSLRDVDWTSVSYPVDCDPGVRVLEREFGDVTGDDVSDAVIEVTCAAGAGSPPSAVFFFDGVSARRAMKPAQVLITSDQGLLVEAIHVVSGRARIQHLGYSSDRVTRCCPDVSGTTEFVWNGSRLVRDSGPQLGPADVATSDVSSRLGDGRTSYCVDGVAANDVLNVRAAPDPSARVVNEVAPGGCDMVDQGRTATVGGDRWVWIYVGDAGGAGWVNSRYLSVQE
jgi:hypothetical protein